MEVACVSPPPTPASPAPPPGFASPEPSPALQEEERENILQSQELYLSRCRQLPAHIHLFKMSWTLLNHLVMFQEWHWHAHCSSSSNRLYLPKDPRLPPAASKVLTSNTRCNLYIINSNHISFLKLPKGRVEWGWRWVWGLVQRK